jgi:hypothetical protein
MGGRGAGRGRNLLKVPEGEQLVDHAHFRALLLQPGEQPPRAVDVRLGLLDDGARKLREEVGLHVQAPCSDAPSA